MKTLAKIFRGVATFFNWAANKLDPPTLPKIDGGMIKKQDGGGGGW